MAYDLAIALRDAGIAVISGFHTSVEKDCLDFLLKGTQPVVVVPARGMLKRVPVAWKKPLEEGRLTIATPFADHEKRVVSRLAEERNRFVADMAKVLFVIHAAEESATGRLAMEQIGKGKRVLTFDVPENQHLLESGCEGIDTGVVANHQQLREALGFSNAL